MDEKPTLPELTRSECRIRAAFYRHLAQSAGTTEERTALARLAEKYEEKATGPFAAD